MSTAHKLRFGWLLILAVFFVLSGALFRLVIAPYLLKLPDSFAYNSEVVSKDNFFDPDKNDYVGETLSVTDYYLEVDRVEGRNLTIKDVFDVKNTHGTQIFFVERFFGIDAISFRHVVGYGDRDRDGYLFAPRYLFLTKQDFDYFHVNYDMPLHMEYVASDELMGKRLYRYEAKFVADQTRDLDNMPQVGETKGINLDVKLSLWVDPISGWIVNYRDDAVAYYYDLRTKERLYPWNHFTNTYDGDSVVRHIQEANEQGLMIIMLEVIVPFGLLFLGLALGLIYWRGGNSNLVKRILLYALPFMIVILSVGGWYWAQRSNQGSLSLIFEDETKRIGELIRRRIEVYQNTLVSGKALFGASDYVDRAEWAKFAEIINLQDNYPGIQGFGFAKYFRQSEKQEIINEVRRDGYPDFRVIPETLREEYTAIVYLEPLDERNLRAFGYDMMSDPTRRKAIEAARDTGEPAMTSKVVLLQEDAGEPLPGFLIYVPVYQQGVTTNSVSERREAIVGYVYAPFRINDFMEGILNEQKLTVGFRIYDGDTVGDSSNLLYDSQRDVTDTIDSNPFVKVKTIFVAGHPWTIEYHGLAKMGVNSVARIMPWGILFAGIILAGAIFVVLLALINSESRAKELAYAMTEELEAKTKDLTAINQKLVKEVDERIKSESELRAKTTEIERTNRLMVGRELRMRELKEIIARLKK